MLAEFTYIQMALGHNESVTSLIRSNKELLLSFSFPRSFKKKSPLKV